MVRSSLFSNRIRVSSRMATASMSARVTKFRATTLVGVDPPGTGVAPVKAPTGIVPAPMNGRLSDIASACRIGT